MAAPPLTPFTADWLTQLPAFIRAADPATDYHLAKLLITLGDQADVVRQALRRIDFIPLDEGGTGTPSALADGTTADAAWLKWLALALGVPARGNRTTIDLRAAITNAGSGWRGPTRAAVADAARSALTGTRFVEVRDHYTAGGGAGTGSVTSQWQLGVVTLDSQTPDRAAVLAAIDTAGVKPAGVQITSEKYAATIARLESTYLTVGAYDGLTVQQVEETGAA